MYFELFLGLTLLYFLWKIFGKPLDYPPGYWGLPLVGYIPLGKKTFDEHLFDLQKKYGDVAIWRMGTRIMVFVYDFKLIKAITNQDQLDRPDIFSMNFLSENKNIGLIGSNGLPWHNNRRFTLRHLRDLGMGKSKLVSVVQHEALEVVDELKKTAGKPTYFSHALTVAVLNVVWKMVANKRYNLDDPELHKYEDLMNKLQNNFARLFIPDFLTWLNYLPQFIVHKIMNFDAASDVRTKLKGMLQEVISEHEKNLDENNPGDYIDEYLVEMKQQKSDLSSTMSMDDLLTCICELFMAGSETTRTTLQFAILYLAKFPDVQKRLQAEVDEVLPQGALPTLEAKIRLPYTEATIHEVLRHVSLIPISLMTVARSDMQLGGYTIPKGSFINPVAMHVHYNPKHYESPEEFRPERFLNAEKKFSNPKDAFMPFGNGKRQCLGEPLARMELLIFLTILVQNLQFLPAPGKTINLSPAPNSPTMHFPLDQLIVMKTR